MCRKCRGRYDLTALIAVLACAIGAPTPASAQQGAKAAAKKWRPRDGLYFEAGTNSAGSCQDTGRYLFELSKKSFLIDEAYGCRVTRIIDTAPGALRLDMTCDASEITGDKSGMEIMTLRKIDDESFFMQLSRKGEAARPEWRVNYCPAMAPDKWPSAFEIKRDAVQKQLKTTEWQPRDGVYAKPGADFESRCSKSGDAVIELGQISISTDASHCEVASIESSTQASIKIDARCDLHTGQTGTVARSIRGEIVFAPVGSEKIIITDSGNQTVSIQKSRNGEFSEDNQLFAYCPASAQRAYADSKKVK